MEYVLTGAEAFTVAEQVQLLANAIGRDIQVRRTDDARRGRSVAFSQRRASGAG
jgi:uncharacterized protein YbjT (DUF2867 family)